MAVRKQVYWPSYFESDCSAQATAEEWCRHGHVMPNVLSDDSFAAHRVRLFPEETR
jgi:hypothetical protein